MMYVNFSKITWKRSKWKHLRHVEGNQLGMSDLALPEGADDFVVYYDARSKDLEACLEKRIGVLHCCEKDVACLVHECEEMESGFILVRLGMGYELFVFICVYMWIMWDIGNKSIECDHLNEIGMVVKLIEFISFTFE
ncbi:hypothetical protein Tco_0126693 [Tanacetum coccineum]